MISDFIQLLAFLFVFTITPGPANMLCMTGGTRHGVLSCRNFIVGLVSGQIVLNILFGFGFGFFLNESPTVQSALKFTSATYMIWLALQSWNQNNQARKENTHFRFINGLWVHPLNPKAWVMSIIAWASFASAFEPLIVKLVVLMFTFIATQFIAHYTWCWLGQVTGNILKNSLLLTRILIVITVLIVIWAVLV